jgi:hypothetical protein
VTELTIVIFATHDVAPLEETLLSVLENRPDDCEIVVAHPSSYDDPYDLASEVQFIELPSTTDPLTCIQAGIDANESEFVHLLAAGHRVQAGWHDEALDAFDDPQVAMVTPLVLRADAPHRVVSLGVKYSAGGSRKVCRTGRVDRIAQVLRRGVHGPTLAAGFYRREALEAVGGLSPSVGAGFADVDVARSLQTIGYSNDCVLECRILANQDAVRQRGFQAGRMAQHLFMRHAKSVGWGRALAALPWSVLAAGVTALPTPAAITEVLGRLVGGLELGHYFAHARTLRAAPQPNSTSLGIPPADETSDEPLRRAA